MFMMVLNAVTALSVSALASCVSRSASVEATVASATLALPAAASNETLVALLVAVIRAPDKEAPEESITCPLIEACCARRAEAEKTRAKTDRSINV